jgi:HSP20 family protein
MFGITPFNRQTVRRNDDQDKVFDLFESFFSDGMFPLRSLKYDTFKLDVTDENDIYIIEADLPGVKKDNVLINYQDGYLSIEINHKEEKSEQNQKNYLHRERRTCQMKRALNLGELDIASIDASLSDGILTIKAPKAKKVEQKTKIEIKP